MALTIDAIMSQLQGLFGGGTTPPPAQVFAAPNPVVSPSGITNNNTTVMPESSTGIGMNIGTGQMAFQGLSSLAGILGGMESMKLAKDSFKLNKQMSNTNLNNQIKSYNTALEDRARSRAAVEGQTSAEQQSYVDRNRLTRG